MLRGFAGVGLLSGVIWFTAGCGGGGSASGTGGSTGGTGTGGSGNTMVMKDPSNYNQTAGATFPFPQGHASACSFPVYNTDDIYAAYQNWKAKFFDGSKVVRPENGNDTVSEGIGYGMLIGVFMNDQPMFDALWSFAKNHNDGKGLMTWCVPGSGSGSCSGGGSATDGDEDMAYALLMASKQWHSKASYASDATTLINAIMSNEVDSSSNVLKPGDSFGALNYTNPSYLAPSYYRAFAKATGNSKWMDVVTATYGLLGKASGQYGLVPNWVSPSGSPSAGPTSDGSGVNFGYDACRTPFRVGIDACLNGDSNAKSYAGMIAGFYASKSSATSTAGIMDGYTPAGANPSGQLGDYAAGMAFIGPGAVAAMAAGNDTFRDNGYKTIWAGTTQGAMKLSGVFSYYHASWGVLSMLAMSGNFWDMSQ